MKLLPQEIDRLKWNAIVVIDSLADRPGKELHESQHKWLYLQHNTGAGYCHAPDKETLMAALNQIRESISEEGLRPILHFEMHGSEQGLELLSGELIEWLELCEHLRELNSIMQNTLLIVLAACSGVGIGNQINALLRAPFRCAIAAVGRTDYGKLEEGFNAFYEALPRGVPDAVRALNNYSDDGGFAYLDITDYFDASWQSFVTEYNTASRIEQLADYLYEIGRFKPGMDIDTARIYLTNTLLGGDNTKWAVYRAFMIAEHLDDAGQNVFHYAQ
jgi:hypothetical protein